MMKMIEVMKISAFMKNVIFSGFQPTFVKNMAIFRNTNQQK
jgi:hypothetical protein